MKINRLTKRGAISERDINELMELSNENQFGPNNAYFKLQEYEDLEEQKLLLKLSCKVGDIVYMITKNFISEYRICKISIYPEGIFYFWTCVNGIYPDSFYADKRGFTQSQIDKTIFIIREDAEKELKRRMEEK